MLSHSMNVLLLPIYVDNGMFKQKVLFFFRISCTYIYLNFSGPLIDQVNLDGKYYIWYYLLHANILYAIIGYWTTGKMQ